MRKLTFIACLAFASAAANASPLTPEKERELRFATLAVLSYSGFVSLVQRECLPAKPAPKLLADWQKRHQRILDSADAFAEAMFDKVPVEKGGRAQSQMELTYLVGNASAQLYREQTGSKDKKQACPELVAQVRDGEFDAGAGRRMQPHALALTTWNSSQMGRK